VSCRDANDCPADMPVCDVGTCRQCTENAECSSGACASDGTCVPESEIAFADPNGTPTADCTRLSPCTLKSAVALVPPRGVIELLPGAYISDSDLKLSGLRRVIGAAGTRPSVTRAAPGGPIFQVEVFSDVSFEHLEIFGATNSPGNTDDGRGVSSPYTNNDLGSRTVRIDDDYIHDNAYAGIGTNKATVVATRSTFENNGAGVFISDANATIDRCTASGNVTGYNLDAGIFAVTNSFAVRNAGQAIEAYVEQPGTHIDFVTLADNGGGIHIQAASVAVRVANSIVARSGTTPVRVDGGGSVATTGSILTIDAAGLNFRSPDVAPFDYHITAGSVAIDAADPSVTSNHDVDGGSRPMGAAMDVGADELK